MQLFSVPREAAARAAHSVSRPDHDRVADLLNDLLGFLNARCDLTARHRDFEAVHRVLECLPVFAALDRVCLNADHLNAVFREHAALVQRGGQVEPGLAAEIRQHRIRPLDFNYLLDRFGVQWLDVCPVRHAGVGHDRCRIGVHQHDLVTGLTQRLASLRAGVVELTRLADDDRPGTDDEYLVDVFASGHFMVSFQSLLLERVEFITQRCAFQ